MKSKLLLAVAILLFVQVAHSQTWQWAKPERNGSLDPNSEHDDAHDVEMDALGNVYVLGDFLDSLFLNKSFRAAGNGSYLAKYDSTGTLLWYKLIIPTGVNASQGYIKATDLTVTNQGVFITGKYKATGPGGSYDCSTGIFYGSSYSYNLGSFNFTSVYREAGFFVTKFNANGGVTWNRLLTGGYCAEQFRDVVVGQIAYNPVLTSDKNGNIISGFQYTNGSPDLTSISIGSGSIPLPLPTANENNSICIVFKMNNAGTLLWSNYAAEQEMSYVSDDCYSIISDNNGNVFLYGIANDGCAFGSNIFHTTEYIKNGNRSWSTYIAKISAAGTWELAKELHTYAQNWLELGQGNPDKLAVDNSNNVYAAVNLCCNYPIIMGDTVTVDKTNAYLVKFDNTGNLIWHKGFGSNQTLVNSISFANNALYLSGRVTQSVITGIPWYFSDLYVQPSSISYGIYEDFAAKANTDGNFKWVTTFSGDPDATGVAEGFAIKAFNGNIYSAGYYRGNITTLGNFNSNYTGDASTHNLFFGRLKDQYIKVGAVSATEVVPGCNITIPFTSNGLTFSANNMFIAELSSSNSEFTNPTVIGSVTSSGNGVINAIVPTSLPLGTSGYKIRIRSTDTLPTGLNYYAYADTGYALKILCPTPSSGFAVTNITNNSATLNWATVPCGAGYRIQYRIKGSSSWITAPIVTNNNTAFFNLTGLTANTTYQWRIATRCKSNSVFSFSAYTSAKQFKTTTSFAIVSFNDIDIRVANGFKITVLPNPANSIAILSIEGSIKNATVSITDLQGKTIWMKSDINNSQVDLPIHNIAPGMYIVKLSNGNDAKVAKLIKE